MSMTKEKLVVVSGAGISAESGIQTFRGTGGMWGDYDIKQVASPRGWQENPQLVADFYNHRIDEMSQAEPNEGHRKIAELEEDFDVTIITQNVDGLHEAAGSSSVIHIHGSIQEKRHVASGEVTALEDGERFEAEADGTFLYRPNIVWFGESVMKLDLAGLAMRQADVCLVIGTSLQVSPANMLHNSLGASARRFIVDPNASDINPSLIRGFHVIEAPATTGMQEFVDELRSTTV